MTLDTYRTLGRSGLAVSPLALGTMTFGAERWGSGEAISRSVFDAYVDAGGNFMDTADVYSGGRSEAMLGGFVAERALRDRLVIATKAGFSREQGHPHAGGNGAKNINRALEGSLRRLRTDYVDLFWLHVWDQVTPAEEVLQTLTGLVRAGKIRHYGISNAPTWYIAMLATLATAHALPAPVALQYQYSLAERGVEAELLGVAREFRLGLQPWSPLAGGFLTGKYRREDVEGRETIQPGLPSVSAKPGEENGDGKGRLRGSNPFGDTMFTERNWLVLDALRGVAEEAGKPLAQVALAWVVGRPGVQGALIGASKVEQLMTAIAALGLILTPEQLSRLEEASVARPTYPSSLFTPVVRRFALGGADVKGWEG